MSDPRVSFSSKLASVAAAPTDRDRPAQEVATPTKKVVWLRILALALIVFGIGTALHVGTREHRDEKRRAEIELAISSSGVSSSASPEQSAPRSDAP